MEVNCEQAFRFYEKHLGGKVAMMMTHGQQPNAKDVPSDQKNAILYARMSIGETDLMGSDVPSERFQPMRSVYLSLSVNSIDEAARIFALLSDGAEIFMPMQETFFAFRFAVLRDRFGTSWMIINERTSPQSAQQTYSLCYSPAIIELSTLINKKGAKIPMQTITPHLWFDKEAKEAAQFYTSIFKDSEIKNTGTLHNTPSGTVDLLTIELLGQEFRLISAGPLFKFTPAVSFLVACDTKDEVDALWRELSNGGSALMELGEYPFSERYGWTQDRYGLSWQVMFMGDRKIEQRITPTLMFVGEQCGRAEEAINFYASVFHNAKVGHILRYGKNEEPDKAGTIKHAGVALEGESLAVMDSARAHNFTFNEAISFMVHCNTQEEIDYFWSKLSADRKAEQCGWLKDKFGLSWQIVPTVMDEMLEDKNETRLARVTEAFLEMKKVEIAKLKEAYGQGRSAA